MDPAVIFEDDDLLVVDKPAGMVVHPAPGHETGTLCQWALRHCPAMAGVGSETRPGVVHRLDGGTSGVMVMAKTQRAYRRLRELFESHTAVEKTYLAVLHGAPRPLAGTVDEPVGRERLGAVSHYRVLGRSGTLALVEFRIETGRMHQIRQHAKWLGHPVVGDDLYGDALADRRHPRASERLLLHAVRLKFPHPVTGRAVVFDAPPPAELVYAR